MLQSNIGAVGKSAEKQAFLAIISYEEIVNCWKYEPERPTLDPDHYNMGQDMWPRVGTL